MAAFPHLFALALAAAQPAPAEAATAARADSAALLELFDRVCLRGEDAPAGFAPVEWSAFPEPLRLLNTYDHAGTFLRSEAPTLTYVARTRGPAHMAAGVESRCGAAVRGADTRDVVARLARMTGAQVMPPMATGGMTMTMLMGDGAFTVYSTEDQWVIVRSLRMMIALPQRSERRRRGRRGDRN
ncbi:MAG TPA: hypothetical protein VD887_04545 [Allosphingosinicella sp.]|nr:hypothetical protein [Allosphingosinicella sp.]